VVALEAYVAPSKNIKPNKYKGANTTVPIETQEITAAKIRNKKF
jgi:hypothetical protein